jgi:hypothetical protein
MEFMAIKLDGGEIGIGHDQAPGIPGVVEFSTDFQSAAIRKRYSAA